MIDKNIPYANNIFEQPWWLDIVAPGKWDEIISTGKDGKVMGRMAYVHDDKKVYLPQLTQTTGIWLDNSLRQDYGGQKKVIYELFERINKYKNINLHLAAENDYVLPFRWMGYNITPCFTYRIEDLSDCDAIYSRFNKTAKKNIKSARNKVEIKTESNADHMIELLKKTFSAQERKNPIDENTVRNIMKFCDDNDCGHYVEAVDTNGNIHSCAYFVYDDRIFYYLLGGSDSEYRTSGAQSLVIWEGIQYASNVSRVFDFEGSMIEGIENFFRQFAGRCVPYYEVRRQGIVGDILQIAKPRVKKIIGYKN